MKEDIKMNEFNVEGHEASLLPAGRWKMVWNDEFDGDRKSVV